MCDINTIPYFKEIVISIVLLLLFLSFFKKEKCPCEKEINELKDEIKQLKEALKE